MVQAFSLLTASEVVLTTTSGAASDDKVDIMIILGFQCVGNHHKILFFDFTNCKNNIFSEFQCYIDFAEYTFCSPSQCGVS